MNSLESTTNRGAQLNIIDDANRAKCKSCAQEHTNISWSRCIFRFLKSRTFLLIAIVLGFVVTCAVTVLVFNSGPKINEETPDGPCSNFYNFSCHRWNEQNPIPEGLEKWDVFSASSRKFSRLVSEILEESFQHDEIKGFRHAKSLYKNCLSYYSEGSNHTKRNWVLSGMPIFLGNKEEDISHLPTEEFCSQLVQNQFAPVVLHKYIMRKYADVYQLDQIRAEVQQMFENIKAVFDGADSTLFSELAKNTKVCIGFPDWILNSTKVQSKYDRFLLNDDDQFEMQLWKTGMWRVIQYLLNRIKTNNTPVCWENLSKYSFEAEGIHTEISQLNKSQILIYVPLGILEPPFFQLNRSKAMNYGSLGHMIGHELAHAYLGTDWKSFTDQNLESLAGCLKRQYSNFTFTATAKQIALNGELTLEENLTDNLGLLASYIAYSKLDGNQHKAGVMTSMEALDENATKQYEPPGHQTNQPPLSQLTDDQIFFLSFSQAWCQSSSNTYMETKMQVSGHAPGNFRVLGTLENSNEFAKAWNCSNQSNNRQTCKLFLAKTFVAVN